MERDLDKFFKPGDFDFGSFAGFNLNSDEGRLAAVYVQEFLIKVSDQANAILSQWLKEQVTVYRSSGLKNSDSSIL